MYEIADILLARVKNQLVEQQIDLEVKEPAKAFLVEKGFDVANGARPLRREIQSLIEDALAEGMLSGRFYPGMKIIAERDEEGIKLTGISPEPLAVEPAVDEEATPAVTAETEG